MDEKAKRFIERKERLKKRKDINNLYEVVNDGNSSTPSNSMSDKAFSSMVDDYEKSFTVDYDRQATLIWKHGAIKAYCSWCLEKTWHGIDQANGLTRHDYRCNNCTNFTLKCRMPTCSHMATHKPSEVNAKTYSELISQNWASEFCAEHDGTIPDFETLNERLSDISDFKHLYKKEKFNAKAASQMTGAIIVSAGAVATGAWIAAPWAASTLGSLGLLGAAGTGTAISSLSGAALSSASLAAIGPGGMAGGVGVLTAAGAALGAKEGAAIGSGYFGEIEDFDIINVREGKGPALIFINGFLSQKPEKKCSSKPEELAKDWLESVADEYPDNPCYILTWESSTLWNIGKLLLDASKAGTKEYIEILLKGTKKSSGPLTGLLATLRLINNPWHKAMTKAEMTGVLLADIIARTDHEDGFIIMGHSLGARVAYYALNALATKEQRPRIKEVYLLGGAVGNNIKDWKNISSSVEGTVFNVHSDRDDILKYAYKIANVFVSHPIGLNPINTNNQSIPTIADFNASHLVSGHAKHKQAFKSVLKELVKVNKG